VGDHSGELTGASQHGEGRRKRWRRASNVMGDREKRCGGDSFVHLKKGLDTMGLRVIGSEGPIAQRKRGELREKTKKKGDLKRVGQKELTRTKKKKSSTPSKLK